MEGLESVEISGDVLPNGGVGTAPGFDGGDTGCGKSVVGCQEFGIFTVGGKGFSVNVHDKRPRRREVKEGYTA